VTPRIRNLGDIPLTIDADVLAVAPRKNQPGFRIDDFVSKGNLSAPDLVNPTPNRNQLIVSGWLAVPNMEL
jgi:hypothetical protein